MKPETRRKGEYHELSSRRMHMFRIRNLLLVAAMVGVVGLAFAGCSNQDQPYGGGAGRALSETDEVRGYRGRTTAAVEQPVGRFVTEATDGTVETNFVPLYRNAVIEDHSETIAVTGTLREDGTEWYLDSADGEYLLGFGPLGYRESIGMALEDGMTARIEGFADDDEIAVWTCEVGGSAYTFRTEDGAGLWSGRYQNTRIIADPDQTTAEPGVGQPRGGRGQGAGRIQTS